MAESAAKGLLWTDDGRAYKTNPRTGKKVYYADLNKEPTTTTGGAGGEGGLLDTRSKEESKQSMKLPTNPTAGTTHTDEKGTSWYYSDYGTWKKGTYPGKGGGGDGGGGTDDGTTEPSIMDMDTDVDIAGNPIFNPDFGPAGPSTVTDEGDGTGTTVLNPDGSVKLGDVSAHSREVQDEELVANQMNSLLASDSKFIQDARRQGLEQANALGGLGGTVGIGAAQQSAMRAALPIAEADAQAYRTAATENLEALNRFSQLNHQRATQLEMSNISAATSLATTKISASVQWASQQLTSATQRDISRLDNETRLRATEMGGAIQERMAGVQYKFNKMLNEMQNNFGLQNTALQGEYMIKANEIQHQMQRETNYINMATGVYDSFMNQLTQLNGMEMDNNARQAAINTITTGAQNLYKLINSLFPDMTPIEFG